MFLLIRNTTNPIFKADWCFLNLLYFQYYEWSHYSKTKTQTNNHKTKKSTLVWTASLNMTTFQKWQKEKFSLPPPLLTLAQIQTFHYSILKKKTGMREHLVVFLLTSVCHLESSLTNLWQRFWSSIGSTGFIVCFQYFEGIRKDF